MVFRTLARFFSTTQRKINFTQVRKCRSVFGIKELIAPEKRLDLRIHHVKSAEHQDLAVDIIKRFYLNDHVLVQARNMDLSDDCSFDEYLTNVVKQGNTIFAVAEDDAIAGICVGYASSQSDVKELRDYAYYRQVPHTKEFLYFTAKLQETPSLWDVFKQSQIFEVRMLAVMPEFRRQGVATFLTETARQHAYDQGLNVIRMDCMNPYDYKIAERCMLQCIAKYPLHKLRDEQMSFIERDSPFNRLVRVYVGVTSLPDAPDLKAIKRKHEKLEKIIEVE